MRLISFFLFLYLSLFIRSQAPGFNTALLCRLQNEKITNQKHNVLVQGNISKLKDQQQFFGFDFNYSAGDVASITCDLKVLSILIDRKIIKYAEFIDARKQPMNDTMLRRNRIIQIKNAEAPLTQSYDGTGIVLGIIDTGIDFNHPDFKDSQNKTRIKYLWDQVPAVGSSTPSPFNYGIEWRASQIDSGLCTHSDAPYWGHGTHVAGIAAGNGRATNTHFGVAPKTDLVVVAVNFNRTGPVTADAVTYIFSKATALGKPCVINASIGDYYGSHDATDLESKLIENQVKNIPGRALVAAVGNAGAIKYHVKTVLNGDTAFTWLKTLSPVDYWWYADTAQVKNVEFTIGANRNNYSDLGNIGFKNYNYALNTLRYDTLWHNGNRIGIVKSVSSVNPSGVHELYIQVLSDSANLLWRAESKGTGLHHAWNFDFLNVPLPSTTQFPRIIKYVKPDTFYTMVSGFQCSDEVITVGNYFNARTYYDVNGTLRDNVVPAGSMGGGSSMGPTRDGRQKPDISSSGQLIFSAGVLSLIQGQINADAASVAQGSMHVIGGGSSAASPIVAGLGALYLEKNPTATNRKLKEAIINCAYKDNFTGNNLPDYKWGYGKLDGKNTLLCGENLPGIFTNVPGHTLSFFPNPFSHNLNISVSENIYNGTLKVFAADGKLLHTEVFNGTHVNLDGSNLVTTRGLLLITIADVDHHYSFKALKE